MRGGKGRVMKSWGGGGGVCERWKWKIEGEVGGGGGGKGGGVRGGKGRTCSDTVQYNQSDTWQLTLTNQTASGDGTEYQ